MTDQTKTTSDRIDDLDRLLTAAKAKLAPLKERTESLNEQSVVVRKQLGELVERLTAFSAEVAAVQQEVLDTDKIFDAVAIGLVDARGATERAANLEAANQTLSSMFGEAFQVVSRFFETAQRLGLVAKNTTEPDPSVSLPPQEPAACEEPKVVEETEYRLKGEPGASSFLDVKELADLQSSLPDATEVSPVELPQLPDVASNSDEEESDDIKDVEALLAELSVPIST